MISTVVKTHTDFDLNFSEVLNQIAFQILNMQASNLSEREGHRREHVVLNLKRAESIWEREKEEREKKRNNEREVRNFRVKKEEREY